MYTHDYPPKSVPLERRDLPTYVPNSTSFDGSSTTKGDYIPHPHARRSLIIPPSTQHPSGTMEMRTTTMDDMQVWPLEKQPRGRPDAQRKDPGPFDGSSSYKMDYPARAGERTMPCKPEYVAQKLGPFEAGTTMRDSFLGTTGARPAPCRPMERPADLGTFDGLTVAKQDYVPHAQTRTGPIKPMDARRSSAPFEGRSDYTESYPRHPLPDRQRPPTAVHRPTPGSFDGVSTTQTDFGAKDYVRRDPILPAVADRPSGPSDYNTTYGATMKAWEPQAVSRVPQPPSLRPSGPFQGTTEVRDNFTPKAMSRTAPIIPSQGARPTGSMELGTSYHDHYIPHELPCSVLRMPQAMWQECSCAASTHPHTHGPARMG